MYEHWGKYSAERIWTLFTSSQLPGFNPFRGKLEHSICRLACLGSYSNSVLQQDSSHWKSEAKGLTSSLSRSTATAFLVGYISIGSDPIPSPWTPWPRANIALRNVKQHDHIPAGDPPYSSVCKSTITSSAVDRGKWIESGDNSQALLTIPDEHHHSSDHQRLDTLTNDSAQRPYWPRLPLAQQRFGTFPFLLWACLRLSFGE